MMSVTRDEVVWAYRMFLGRDPENETVIQLQMEADNLDHLRSAFLGSDEFRRKFSPGSGGPVVSRYLEIDSTDIDISCTDNELQAMFDRIGAAWKRFGETEPHWSVLTVDDFRQDKLAANIDAFYASGPADIGVHANFLKRAGLPTRFAKAMDFGCGVGRLTLALAPHADQVVGIDISPPHLKLAEERRAQTGVANVTFESIASVDDLDRYGGFDFVLSRIVLQHNPPPVMAAIYRKLLAALAPGGVSIVQMPTHMRGQRFSTADYLANAQPDMEMNALPQKVIFEIIERSGCRPLEVREDGAAGEEGLSHSFLVQRVR
jgi:2-polyprenyl-3-methyl-5-hydroxy-6-metoxy-1,4-benzoquinol methylase